MSIDVADTGVGVPAEHRARIFEPFYRDDDSGEGFGLGLAIAAQAVEAMHGELLVGEADRGARFTIRLPVAMSGRILVVEDEPAISEAVAYALREAGYEVDGVDDGNAAIAAARDQRYDLMVLDLVLPGSPGLDVCRTLGGERPADRHADRSRRRADRVVGLEIGADDYLTKPFSVAELVSRVRALLRRRELDRNDGAAVQKVGIALRGRGGAAPAHVLHELRQRRPWGRRRAGRGGCDADGQQQHRRRP